MPRPRKKATARKASKPRATARKKVAAKKPVQLKAIEKTLTATLKKALDTCKREAKKATAEATKFQKKIAAAEKKSNSALTKQTAAEKKLAVKDSKQAKKALATAKKAVTKATAVVGKLQKQFAPLEKEAQGAKCREQKFQALTKAIAAFHSDWQKQEKSAQHQADFHAPAKKKVAVAKPATSKVEVKKVNRAPTPAAPPAFQGSMGSTSQMSKSIGSANPSYEDDSSL